MCGICGIYRTDGGNVDTSVVEAMTRALIHRGPDDEGFFADRGFAMGMRRLSIIDVAGGAQPVFNESRSVAAVHNGEIYNFHELAEISKKKGHRFSSRSDTETIVHLFEDDGPDFVRRLRGMFAVALWDARSKKLFLYRDRLGIKPLYYYRDGPLLAFSSEIKSFLRIPDFRKDLDLQALNLYFSYGYVPGERSIFAAVRKLLPAHWMRVDENGAAVSRYWDFDFTPAPPEPTPDRLEKLKDVIRESVRLHLISDVPLGVFLSGGLDSSTIVSFMRELGADPIRTYSVGFREKTYSELHFARRVARRFDTSHNELIVEPRDLDETLPLMVRHFDEPFADSSALPMFLISRFARRGVTVALSGEGGDETFAGYHTYVASRIAALARRFPLSALTPLLKRLATAFPTSFEKVSLDYKLKKFVENLSTDTLRSHMRWKTIFGDSEKNALFPPAVARELESAGDASLHELIAPVLDAPRDCDLLSRLLWLDSIVFLPDDLLVKNDRMSMANSLEARVPFLDHVLVEHVSKIPSTLKLKGFSKKYILRKAMRDSLGADTAGRAKAGFNVPLPKWLEADPEGRFEAVFSGQLDALDFPLNRDFVRSMFAAHRERKKDYSRQLWTVLNFVLWHNHYVSGFAP
ncbi:MAG: asparagine synthase (glutamine-hydrolyzing) [bacterium]